MELRWHFSNEDIDHLKTFVCSQSEKRIVVERYWRNVYRKDLDISPSAAWRTLVGCLVTTQQASGDGSKVWRFLQSDSPILDFARTRTTSNLAQTARKELAAAGLRRNVLIGQQLEQAIHRFSGNSWKEIHSSLNRLVKYPTLSKERESAQILQRNFNGIGPKQSRNLIQWIGLSRYVVPLDSRFAKHLISIGFPVPTSASCLQDEAFYRFVENGVQHLASAAQVYPCVYDACVFASYG